MRYIAQLDTKPSHCVEGTAILTLIRFVDGGTQSLLVDGETVEVEIETETAMRWFTPNYLDGLERRISAIEEDQERLARIEARDVLEYERLRAKFATREAATRAEPESPAETRCEVCSRAVNIGDDVLYCSEDDTVQHTGCSGLTNARGTPWVG